MDHDIGRSLKFISYHFPTVDISEICENVLKTLVPDEREIKTSRNKVFFMRVAPYRSTENKILGCVITLVDVTTQKQGQVQLASAEKNLSLAREAVEAKSDYLSRISHEIRTPMSALLGLCKMIKQSTDDKSKLNENVDKLSETVEYMASIVTDISEASKVERINSAQIYSEPFALREVINNVVSLVGTKADEAGLELEVSLADDFNPLYVGNRTSLQQILINFLNNSIKYTHRGGAISLKAFEDGEKNEDGKIQLCFVVSDTGIGIGKEFIPQLFDPFSRENSSADNTVSGMGLGLSIANNLIISMDGSVKVESEVGKGTTFTIHVVLEKYEKPDICTGDILLPPKINLSGRNILVAEDNSLNRTILCALLAKEGIRYSEACDGESAVNIYTSSPSGTFDCILMDMRMPKLDGIKATIMIRNSGKLDANTIPIIGVSANGFADDIKQAKFAGITAFTSKPIDKDKLLSLMRTAIGSSTMHK